jgi:hypothetical protein
MNDLLLQAGFAIHDQSTTPGASAPWLEFVCVAI